MPAKPGAKDATCDECRADKNLFPVNYLRPKSGDSA
jgi:hypothetical protein